MLQKTLLFFTIILFSCVLASEDELFKHPDEGLKVPELVPKYGYPLESHTLTTSDNYILTIHRIPHGINNANVTNKPVVLLMHGLLSSSMDWVVTGPERGLAYLLADLGYDVWMGNARGNYYSRKHVYLEPDYDKDFWKFSWHEIGVVDLPTMIDHILDTTKVQKIFYIGHSQGSTTFFVMATSLPEYNDKIKLMVGLGPAVYMKHTKSNFNEILIQYINVVNWIAKMLGQYEFLPSTEFIQDLSSLACNDEAITQEICSNILFLICGFDNEQLNKTILPLLLSNTPAGAATKQFIHYGQGIKSGKFRQFDYGLMNLIHYNRLTPPKYEILKVIAPVALFSSKNDKLVSIEDVEDLFMDLPNPVLHHIVEFEKFSHLDFIWANDVKSLLYDDVFKLMNEHINK